MLIKLIDSCSVVRFLWT